MRLTRLFLLTTGLLLSLVTALLLRSVWVDWHTVSTAETGLAAMQRAYLAMQVAEKASAERGPANQVLSDGEPADPAKRTRLAQFRHATDAAFEAADAALAQAPAGAAAIGLVELRQARQELARARAELDRVAALPHALRSAPGARVTRSPVDAMFAVIDTLFGGVTTLSAEAEAIYPELALSLVGARHAAELREYAGRLGSEFNTPLATQAPLTRGEQHAIQRLEGRIEQLRRLISLQARRADAPLRRAVERMEARYFGENLPFVHELTARGQAGQAYGVDAAAFVARYVPPMGSIVELRDTLFEAGRQAASARVAATRERLIVNLALGLAVLGIELGVFLLIRHRVLKPLLSSTRTMTAIMQGRVPPPDQTLPTDRDDEIGAMQRAVAALRDATLRSRALEAEREQLIEQLRVASDTDFLTGLPNRRAFTERADGLLAQARRHGWPVALLVFDLDHFKRINDLHGHQVGDRVLRTAAAIARDEVRAGELLARHGGEEFVVLAPDCGPDQALQLAERLRAALADAPVATADGQELRISASFGLACTPARGLPDLDRLFHAADQALYAAKSRGRNRVVLAGAPVMTAQDAG
ncbi:MAG: diguanylate cyclase [Comamonadaceae bacterium]|nr:diguanylate cyclase [Comamonadaceae bacterium]